jgi:uncharacterized protein (TIGR03437 family)
MHHRLFAALISIGIVAAQSNCPIVSFPSLKSAALLPTPSTHRFLLKQSDGSYTAHEMSNTSPYSTIRTVPHFDRQLSPCLPTATGLRTFLVQTAAQTPSGGYITGSAQAFGADVAVFDAQLNLLAEAVTTVPVTVFADLNGDGIPDIIGTPPFQHNGSVTIALGTGGANFQTPVVYPTTMPSIQQVLVADLNGDHKPDLVVVGFGLINVYIGNGDGTLQPGKQIFKQFSTSGNVAIADLNGDGIPDLVYGDSPNTFPILNIALGVGDGTFKTPTQIPSSCAGVVIGDLNGDGIPDLLSCGTLLFGDGKGSFPTRRDIALPYGAQGGPIITDFDGDGIADIVFGTGSSSIIVGDSVSVIFGLGKGTFSLPPVSLKPSATFLGQTIMALASADLNGDGIPDLVSADDDRNITIFKGAGNGSFQSTLQFNVFQNGIPWAIVIADFNGDGKLDLAVVSNFQGAAGTTGSVAIVLGNGDGTFQSPGYLTAPTGANAMVTGDFNGDGKPDLAVLSSQEEGAATDTVQILLGNGDGTFKTGQSYTVGPYAMSIVAGDFNGDGKSDLVIANSGTPALKGKDANLALLIGKGDGTFAAPVTIPPPAAPFNMVAADFNNDGKLDLAVTTGDGAGLMIFLGRGDGTFQTAPYDSGPAGPLAAADLNGDGILDLIFSTTYRLGNGDGTFKSPASVPGAEAPFVVADLNHDGKLDIAASYGQGIAGFLNISPPAPSVTVVPATTLVPAPIAPASIATAFSKNLFGAAPTVSIEDSAGVTAPATLFYASPSQINFALPAGLDAGPATLTIGSQQVPIELAPVSPSIFTLTPGGLAAAYVTRATPFASTYEPVFTTQNGVITPVPIDVVTPAGPAYLVLFGTGLRNASGVVAYANNETQLNISYAGPQPGTPGLDQVNLLLPSSLAGSGYTNIVVSTAQAANAVYILIK